MKIWSPILAKYLNWDAGQSGNLTVNLKSGNYMLVCNMPGHYKMNMFTKLLVTP